MDHTEEYSKESKPIRIISDSFSICKLVPTDNSAAITATAYNGYRTNLQMLVDQKIPLKNCIQCLDGKATTRISVCKNLHLYMNVSKTKSFKLRDLWNRICPCHPRIISAADWIALHGATPLTTICGWMPESFFAFSIFFLGVCEIKFIYEYKMYFGGISYWYAPTFIKQIYIYIARSQEFIRTSCISATWHFTWTRYHRCFWIYVTFLH